MTLAQAVDNQQLIETPWTSVRLARMASLWAMGLSARETAEKLNAEFGTGFTRSAVIGKVHRGKLPQREVENRGKWVRENTIRLTINAPSIDDALIPTAQRRTLLRLRQGDCKWPVGDPTEPDFFFCGGKALDTAPYCAGHAKRAYGYVREPAKF